MAQKEGNYQTNTTLTGALNTTNEDRRQKAHNARNLPGATLVEPPVLASLFAPGRSQNCQRFGKHSIGVKNPALAPQAQGWMSGSADLTV